MAKRRRKPGAGVIAIDQLVDMLDEFGDGFLGSEAGQAFGRLMNVLEAKSVEICPEDEGNLAGSTVVRVEDKGDSFKGTLRYGAEYATAAHERPDDVRGPKTVAKAGNEFGPAGPKYLERALRGFTKVLAEDMGAALQKYWGGQAKRGRGRRRR